MQNLTTQEIHDMSQPSFVMTEAIWNSISDDSRKSILTYMAKSNGKTITINDYREGHRLELGQTDENVPKIIITSHVKKEYISDIQGGIKELWLMQTPANKITEIFKRELNLNIILK